MLTSNRLDTAASYLPASSRLPIEILQQIYHSLSSSDFDAARHTCRLWLFASLDKSLLTSQLIRGGWQAGAEQDLQEAADYFARKRRHTAGPSTPQVDSNNNSQTVSVEWILSKRLAAESRLCADWRGVDISHASSTGKHVLDRVIALRAVRPPRMKPLACRGAISAIPPATFTVSGCGKFVLLTQDRLVFIYTLQNSEAGIRPLTSIFCHRRIVKVSMDTSCGRYAVAILLEGRIGMCCEVDSGKHTPPTSDRLRPSMSLSDFRNFDVCTTSRPGRHPASQPQVDFDLFSTTRSQLSPQAESYRRRGHPLGRSSDSTYMIGSALTLTDSNCHNGSGEEFNPPVPNASLSRFFPDRFVSDRITKSESEQHSFNNFDPISGVAVSGEVGARRIYKNLCSIHDPPSSVAICPQRQCVAFGCKTGVELQWIDALRGSTLSRWFPLAAPSDYLYFVPPRANEQGTSNTKLRLISSAAGPEEFVDADHYRAIALSDGHILFTDPESGHLYLGSDKPGGPTKLRREVLCLPPSGTRPGKTPDCYAAGYEMRWGVRIVVAYGPNIMLYNLPPDHFQRARPTTPGFQVAQSDLAMDVAVDDSQCEPTPLEGVAIHTVAGGAVTDIAVDSGHGGLKVWLFLRGEKCQRKAKKAGMHDGWSSSRNLSLHHP